MGNSKVEKRKKNSNSVVYAKESKFTLLNCTRIEFDPYMHGLTMHNGH